MKLTYGSGPMIVQQSFERISLGDKDSSFTHEPVAFYQVLEHALRPWTLGSGAPCAGIVGLPKLPDIPDSHPRSADNASLLERLGVERFSVCVEPQPGGSGWLMLPPSWTASSPAAPGTSFA